ncbi:MAG: hypothetical protein NZM04_00585 [Methylacidiphilales bacterium]|nr:hypothetical protein [Candidatus Methylacidiphilales bacterium]
MADNIKIKHFGPIKNADITLGPLTVFTGPQNSGKSLTLKFIKFMNDIHILHNLLINLQGHKNVEIDHDIFKAFFGFPLKENYLIYGDKRVTNKYLRSLLKSDCEEKVVYIPSHRTICLDPVENEIIKIDKSLYNSDIFTYNYVEFLKNKLVHCIPPKKNSALLNIEGMHRSMKNKIANNILDGFRLNLKRAGDEIKINLIDKDNVPLSGFAWTIAQRQFVPILISIKDLLDQKNVSGLNPDKLIIIEEIEMGLHPKDIVTSMFLIFDLVARGYRVILASNSPTVMDCIFAVYRLSQYNAGDDLFCKLFDLYNKDESKRIFARLRELSSNFRAYYFDKLSGMVKDISSLDPASPDEAVSTFGYTVDGRVGNLIARAYANRQIE